MVLQTQQDIVKDLLRGIAFSDFTFNFLVNTTGILPEFKGSLIRGSFGAELRKFCCVAPKLKTCLNCTINDVCIYAKTFESVNRETNNQKFLAHSTHIPHPFVIKDETNNKTYFVKGDELKFRFLVIGEEFISKMPHYVYAFKNTFEKGVKGNKRITMILKSVLLNYKNKEIYNIYNDQTEIINSKYKEKYIKSDDILDDCGFSSRITIEFKTPVRIGNELKNTEIDFKTFIKAILRRLSGIAANYFDKDAKIDAQEYLKDAENVKVIESALEIYNWGRISRKQNYKKIDMSGIKGVIKYTGKEINKYLPLIRLGEYFHIGKWTGFGMGEYIIKEY